VSSGAPADGWPTPWERHLLQAALMPDERAVTAWRAVRPDIDLDRLDGSATAVLPTLRRNLLTHGVEDELFDVFKGVHRYVWARNQLLLAEAMPAVAALEMPTMVLKGAAFVADSRLDAGMRAMNDVDVLVPTERRADAVRVLQERGFAPVGGLPCWYVTDHAPRVTHSFGFERRPNQQLDLHWHVFAAACWPGADEDLWAASVPLELNGTPTRALCPTDDLLLVIAHGLRWSPLPPYRWVLDAAILASGRFGPIDWDRFAAQARLRRLTVAARAGLSLLAELAAIDAPPLAARAAPLEHREFAALMLAPTRRSHAQRALLRHQLLARREERVPARRHVALELERRRRPVSLSFAPIGDEGAPGPRASHIDFSSADAVRDHVRSGCWPPEAGGCWMAGHETRLALGVPGQVAVTLALTPFGERGAVELLADGRPVGAHTRLTGPDEVHGVVGVGGAGVAELRVRTPHVSCLADHGFEEDRTVGLFLRTLLVREAPAPLDGWTVPEGEPLRRWTCGTAARMLTRSESVGVPVPVRFLAHPFPGGRGPLRVELRAGGRRIARYALERGAPSRELSAVVPARAVGARGEVLLEWRIANPGGEGDPRPLGLMFEWVMLGGVDQPLMSTSGEPLLSASAAS
jgi:hypothetical protein